MNNQLQLGALDKETNKYIFPSDASKNKEYKCIDCHKKSF